MREDPKIEDEILRRLTEKGRGRIFFAQEFYDLWPDSSVRFALGAMAEEGTVVRLARGVFCFPRLSEYGMKMILPEPDAIARAVADKTKVRIVPFGDEAAYLVGLTPFRLSSMTYLTDGAPRRIRLSNSRTIEFRHTSEMRIFAFRNTTMQLVSCALRTLKKDNVGPAEKEVLKWRLDSIPKDEFDEDVALCPGWVRDLLLDLKAT